MILLSLDTKIFHTSLEKTFSIIITYSVNFSFSDSQGNTTFETIVTLLTEEADSLLQQQLFDILESTGALLTHPITVNNVTRFGKSNIFLPCQFAPQIKN